MTWKPPWERAEILAADTGTRMPQERLAWFDPACAFCRQAWGTVATVCPEHNAYGRPEHVAHHPPTCQCGLDRDGRLKQ